MPYFVNCAWCFQGEKMAHSSLLKLAFTSLLIAESYDHLVLNLIKNYLHQLQVLTSTNNLKKCSKTLKYWFPKSSLGRRNHLCICWDREIAATWSPKSYCCQTWKRFLFFVFVFLQNYKGPLRTPVLAGSNSLTIPGICVILIRYAIQYLLRSR